MSNKRYIFTKEELEAYEKWLKKLNDDFPKGKTVYDYDELIAEWYRENPCPLPSPVSVPSDETINKIADNNSFYSSKTALDRLSYYEGIKDGYKALRKHIFGF